MSSRLPRAETIFIIKDNKVQGWIRYETTKYEKDIKSGNVNKVYTLIDSITSKHNFQK